MPCVILCRITKRTKADTRKGEDGHCASRSIGARPVAEPRKHHNLPAQPRPDPRKKDHLHTARLGERGLCLRGIARHRVRNTWLESSTHALSRERPAALGTDGAALGTIRLSVGSRVNRETQGPKFNDGERIVSAPSAFRRARVRARGRKKQPFSARLCPSPSARDAQRFNSCTGLNKLAYC